MYLYLIYDQEYIYYIYIKVTYVYNLCAFLIYIIN